MIVSDEIKEIMAELAKPLPSEAIQRTKNVQTKKGYDTDGYGYQFGVNRFNEVLGDKWGFDYEILNAKEGKYGSGGDKYDITVSCHIWIISKDSEHIRSCVGGHTSRTYCDALKGAITNGLKKTAALWGVGRHAYEGALDDDNDPAKCAFEDDKRQNNNNQDQQQNKNKQGTITSDNDNEIASQELCDMVAKITNKGKDKNDKSDYVELFKIFLYKQWNIDSLSKLSADQFTEIKGIVTGAGRKRPNDFRNFLKGYKKYLPSQNSIDTKKNLINNIKSKLSQIFDDRDGLDFCFSNLDTGVATIEDLHKLTESQLIDVFNKVEITYTEHMEAQAHINDQQEASVVN